MTPREIQEQLLAQRAAERRRLLDFVAYGGGGSGSGGNYHHASANVGVGGNAKYQAGGRLWVHGPYIAPVEKPEHTPGPPDPLPETLPAGVLSSNGRVVSDSPVTLNARWCYAGRWRNTDVGFVHEDGFVYAHNIDWSTYKPTAPEPKPEPAPQVKLCACGAELMGEKAVMRRLCGDCTQAQTTDLRRGPLLAESLDARIAAAQAPAKDHDPTSEWTAGATPSYDWVGR